jgi:two-component system cell cycle sensor histidine kinase/response regulator CckA
VALPARRELTLPRATPVPGAARRGVGTVLIIDDEPAVRLAVRRILGRAGYETLAASDGRDGLAMFEAHREAVECVIVDLTMPGLSGGDVVSRLRTIRPDIRVVIVSGYDAGSVTGLEAMAHGFLHKPFSATQLLHAVGTGHGS